MEDNAEEEAKNVFLRTLCPTHCCEQIHLVMA